MYVIKYCIDFAGRNVHGLDLQENKTAEPAWNVDYRYCVRSVCVKCAGYKASWYIADLRKIALIIILTRAGLGLDLTSLKKIGRPAVLMCFVPATFELAGMLLLAPRLMGMRLLEAAVMGAVLAAVSPAVVVPRMVKLMEEGYGVKEGIPQLILAGASVDDVYVIVLFSTFSGMMQGEGASVIRFVNIPVSIILGMIIGLTIGVLLAFYFQKVHIRDTAKVLIILGISFLLAAAEDSLTTPVTFSALIAIMFIGVGLQRKREAVAKRLAVKYGKLWVAAEVFYSYWSVQLLISVILAGLACVHC